MAYVPALPRNRPPVPGFDYVAWQGARSKHIDVAASLRARRFQKDYQLARAERLLKHLPGLHNQKSHGNQFAKTPWLFDAIVPNMGPAFPDPHKWTAHVASYARDPMYRNEFNKWYEAKAGKPYVPWSPLDDKMPPPIPQKPGKAKAPDAPDPVPVAPQVKPDMLDTADFKQALAGGPTFGGIQMWSDTGHHSLTGTFTYDFDADRVTVTGAIIATAGQAASIKDVSAAITFDAKGRPALVQTFDPTDAFAGQTNYTKPVLTEWTEDPTWDQAGIPTEPMPEGNAALGLPSTDELMGLLQPVTVAGYNDDPATLEALGEPEPPLTDYNVMMTAVAGAKPKTMMMEPTGDGPVRVFDTSGALFVNSNGGGTFKITGIALWDNGKKLDGQMIVVTDGEGDLQGAKFVPEDMHTGSLTFKAPDFSMDWSDSTTPANPAEPVSQPTPAAIKDKWGSYFAGGVGVLTVGGDQNFQIFSVNLPPVGSEQLPSGNTNLTYNVSGTSGTVTVQVQPDGANVTPGAGLITSAQVEYPGWHGIANDLGALMVGEATITLLDADSGGDSKGTPYLLPPSSIEYVPHGKIRLTYQPVNAWDNPVAMTVNSDGMVEDLTVGGTPMSTEEYSAVEFFDGVQTTMPVKAAAPTTTTVVEDAPQTQNVDDAVNVWSGDNIDPSIPATAKATNGTGEWLVITMQDQHGSEFKMQGLALGSDDEQLSVGGLAGQIYKIPYDKVAFVAKAPNKQDGIPSVWAATPPEVKGPRPDGPEYVMHDVGDAFYLDPGFTALTHLKPGETYLVTDDAGKDFVGKHLGPRTGYGGKYPILMWDVLDPRTKFEGNAQPFGVHAATPSTGMWTASRQANPSEVSTKAEIGSHSFYGSWKVAKKRDVVSAYVGREVELQTTDGTVTGFVSNTSGKAPMMVRVYDKNGSPTTIHIKNVQKITALNDNYWQTSKLYVDGKPTDPNKWGVIDDPDVYGAVPDKWKSYFTLLDDIVLGSTDTTPAPSAPEATYIDHVVGETFKVPSGWEGVKHLKPGHLYEFDIGNTKVKAYYTGPVGAGGTPYATFAPYDQPIGGFNMINLNNMELTVTDLLGHKSSDIDTPPKQIKLYKYHQNLPEKIQLITPYVGYAVKVWTWDGQVYEDVRVDSINTGTPTTVTMHHASGAMETVKIKNIKTIGPVGPEYFQNLDLWVEGKPSLPSQTLQVNGYDMVPDEWKPYVATPESKALPAPASQPQGPQTTLSEVQTATKIAASTGQDITVSSGGWTEKGKVTSAGSIGFQFLTDHGDQQFVSYDGTKVTLLEAPSSSPSAKPKTWAKPKTPATPMPTGLVGTAPITAVSATTGGEPITAPPGFGADALITPSTITPKVFDVDAPAPAAPATEMDLLQQSLAEGKMITIGYDGEELDGYVYGINQSEHTYTFGPDEKPGDMELTIGFGAAEFVSDGQGKFVQGTDLEDIDPPQQGWSPQFWVEFLGDMQHDGASLNFVYLENGEPNGDQGVVVDVTDQAVTFKTPSQGLVTVNFNDLSTAETVDTQAWEEPPAPTTAPATAPAAPMTPTDHDPYVDLTVPIVLPSGAVDKWDSSWSTAPYKAKQSGSNPGGFYTDGQGRKWYIKVGMAKESYGGSEPYKYDDRSKNETIAARLYEAAGIAVPKVELIDVRTRKSDLPGGAASPANLGVKSEIVGQDGGKQIKSLADAVGDTGFKTKLYRGFAVDAWIANWDVAGTGWDNILSVDGEPLRVDVGGSMLYRAQGGLKGEEFTFDVKEIDTMRGKGATSDTTKLFEDMTDEQVRESFVDTVAKITDADIDAIVDSFALSDVQAPVVKDKLKKRRFDMAEKLGVNLHDHPEMNFKFAYENKKIAHLGFQSHDDYQDAVAWFGSAEAVEKAHAGQSADTTGFANVAGALQFAQRTQIHSPDEFNRVARAAHSVRAANGYDSSDMQQLNDARGWTWSDFANMVEQLKGGPHADSWKPVDWVAPDKWEPPWDEHPPQSYDPWVYSDWKTIYDTSPAFAAKWDAWMQNATQSHKAGITSQVTGLVDSSGFEASPANPKHPSRDDVDANNFFKAHLARTRVGFTADVPHTTAADMAKAASAAWGHTFDAGTLKSWASSWGGAVTQSDVLGLQWAALERYGFDLESVEKIKNPPGTQGQYFKIYNPHTAQWITLQFANNQYSYLADYKSNATLRAKYLAALAGWNYGAQKQWAKAGVESVAVLRGTRLSKQWCEQNGVPIYTGKETDGLSDIKWSKVSDTVSQRGVASFTVHPSMAAKGGVTGGGDYVVAWRGIFDASETLGAQGSAYPSMGTGGGEGEIMMPAGLGYEVVAFDHTVPYSHIMKFLGEGVSWNG